MTAPRETYPADRVMRRVLFVLRLMDPIAQIPAGERLTVEAKGWGKPQLTRAGEFVWLDPPWDGPHRFALEVRSRDGAFAGFEETIDVPDRPQPPGDAGPFIHPIDLKPTRLYVPPPGLLAVAGMLVDRPKPAKEIAGAEVRLIVRIDDGPELVSTLAAHTDDKGGFVAVASGFGEERLALYSPSPNEPRPAAGAITGRLRILARDVTRTSRAFPLRPHALTRIERPLEWESFHLPP